MSPYTSSHYLRFHHLKNLNNYLLLNLLFLKFFVFTIYFFVLRSSLYDLNSFSAPVSQHIP